MKKYISALIIVAITLLSCDDNKKNKPALNKKQFFDMLIAIHLADGTLAADDVYSSSKNYRPSYYYNSVFEKYNITPQMWDSCVAYYAKNTTEFTKMYDRVIDSLNRLETQYRIKIKEAKLEQDTINLWTRKTAWKIPQDGNPDFRFSIPVSKKGIYTISADIKVYGNDRNREPRIEAHFWKRDSLGEEVKVEFSPAKILKDSVFRTYTIQLEYPDSTYKYLRGNLFATNNKFTELTKHYEIRNIKIYNPEIKTDTTDLKPINTKKIEIQKQGVENLEMLEKH